MLRYYPWVCKYRILMTPTHVVIQEKNACLLLTALRWNSLAIFSHQYFQKTTFFSLFILAFYIFVFMLYFLPESFFDCRLYSHKQISHLLSFSHLECEAKQQHMLIEHNLSEQYSKQVGMENRKLFNVLNAFC